MGRREGCRWLPLVAARPVTQWDGDALRPGLSLVPRQRDDAVPPEIRQNRHGCCRQMMPTSRSVAPLDHTWRNLDKSRSWGERNGGLCPRRKSRAVPSAPPEPTVTGVTIAVLTPSLGLICEFSMRDKGARLSHANNAVALSMDHTWPTPIRSTGVKVFGGSGQHDLFKNGRPGPTLLSPWPPEIPAQQSRSTASLPSPQAHPRQLHRADGSRQPATGPLSLLFSILSPFHSHAARLSRRDS